MPLGITPLDVREDQRSRKSKEMEGGGLYGLFSAQATESISQVLTGPTNGHFNPSCHFASRSKNTWSKCGKRFETPFQKFQKFLHLKSHCALHIWKGIAHNTWLITGLCRSMKALAAAPPWGRLILSVCVCAHQKRWLGASSSSSTHATRRSCLVPPRQGALGGFTYSCHVYTWAKQDLRTLQGGTEEEREVRPKAQ